MSNLRVPLINVKTGWAKAPLTVKIMAGEYVGAILELMELMVNRIEAQDKKIKELDHGN
jgi:hypothetical protein